MAENEIRVHVVRYPGRTNLVMRYRDPFTGKQVARSTETDNQKKAEKAAAIWEDELRSGRYQHPSRMSWECFRRQFEVDAMPAMKETSAANYDSTFKAFEQLTSPTLLADLTTARVTIFARELRKPYEIAYGRGKKRTTRTAQRTEASVARHLRCLKAAARWAHRQGLLLKLPTFDMPKRASGATRMKGRPITGEEFDRMIATTAKVVGEAAAESWKLLLRGLWASGLRISEAMALRWDQKPGGVCVILSGQKSVLSFDADSQKSGKVQLVPLAPEAVQLLEPLQRSSGYVFTPLTEDGRPIRDSLLASKAISAIGRKAGVVVDQERGKYASAHDLRRSFGYRWSRSGITIAELKELMRHANIETTLTYYVGQNAASTAARLWQVLGNTLGNTPEPEFQKPLENKYSPQESNL